MVDDGAASADDAAVANSAPEPREGWGRLLLLGGVLAVVAIVGAMVLLVIGFAILGKPHESSATKLHDIEIETGIASATIDPAHAPQYDVRLGTCEARGRGVRAAGTVTNPTDRPADYRVWLSFRDSGLGASGAEFATTDIVVPNVPEHSTTNWEALVSDRPDGAFACRVLRIDRERTPDAGS